MQLQIRVDRKSGRPDNLHGIQPDSGLGYSDIRQKTGRQEISEIRPYLRQALSDPHRQEKKKKNLPLLNFIVVSYNSLGIPPPPHENFMYFLTQRSMYCTEHISKIIKMDDYAVLTQLLQKQIVKL